MKYAVDLWEERTCTVIIEAETIEEARGIAQKRYEKCDYDDKMEWLNGGIQEARTATKEDIEWYGEEPIR